LDDPKTREKITRIPNYQSLSITQLLAALKSASDVAGGWSDAKDGSIEATFTFGHPRSARRFTTNVLGNACYSHDPLGFSLSNGADGNSVVSVSLKTHKDNGVTAKDIAVANYINYAFALYESSIEESGGTDSGYSSWYYDLYSTGEKTIERYRSVAEDEAQQLSIPSSNISVQCFASTKTQDDGTEKTQYFAKVPVATLGSWKHPVYKTVSFTQTDYDQIIQNFSDGVLGFEPPLFLGHPLNTSTLEGAPAEGFLTELTQEGNELFGLYEIVDDQTYADLQKGKYRYASAEILRQHKDHQGKQKGTVLFGHALTNRPFVPNLPKVETLSQLQEQANSNYSFESVPQLFTLSISEPMSTPTPDTTQTQAAAQTSAQTTSTAPAAQPPTSTPETLSQTTAQTPPATTPTITSPVAASATVETLATQIQSMQGQIAQLLAQHNTDRAEIETLKQVNRSSRVTTLTNEINQMALAQETKDKAIQLLSAGTLGAGEDDYMNVLRATNDQFKGMVLSQNGVTEGTAAAQDPTHLGSDNNAPPVDNPYKQVIEHNKKQAGVT
jgi:pterin-4a-carbinolamine dehydratase